MKRTTGSPPYSKEKLAEMTQKEQLQQFQQQNRRKPGRAKRVRKKRQAKKAAAQMTRKGDVNSKILFENPTLCAEFLRDYSGLEIFANVQPEDIEPVTLRYHVFEDTEVNSDSAVRVLRVRREDGMPIYIIPLIDHKSAVDFNVSMQLLVYMVCIWKSWEKEMDAQGFNCKNKDFRYPMIYPIVYYEGSETWTADLNFASRIWQEDFMKDYTPDFKYHVVRVHDHEDDDLLKKGDAMSLAMLLNKVQSSGDIENLRKLDIKEVDRIVKNTPEDVLDILAGICTGLCRKLNVPRAETDTYIKRLRKDRSMGYLWENMEHMDIQAERRNTKREASRADKAEKRADNAEKRADSAEQRADNAEQRADNEKLRADSAELKCKQLHEEYISNLIATLREFMPDREEVKRRLMAQLKLNEPTAETKMQQYW